MRRNAIKMVLLVSGLCLAIAAGVVLLTNKQDVNAAASEGRQPASDYLAKAIFAVDGMSCGGCVSTIKSALEGFENIADIEVDVAAGKAEVLYRADASIDAGKISEAITKSGYPARLLQMVSAEEVERQERQAAARSVTTIATVGGIDVSRADFEAELMHARSRYKMIYGQAVFSEPRGRQLLDNLTVQIARRLIAERIQLQEIDRAGFTIDSATVARRYQEYLKKRNVNPTAFEAELSRNGYSSEYFLRKFRDRTRIEAYLEEKVIDGAASDIEEQKRFAEWFTNASLMAPVVYHDKNVERLMLSGAGGSGGCGNNCSATN